jgi:hypothetical protein
MYMNVTSLYVTHALVCVLVICLIGFACSRICGNDGFSACNDQADDRICSEDEEASAVGAIRPDKLSALPYSDAC